jgi:threonine dehydrogenase-like Zn-dependent dehydrogenase
MRAAIMRNKKLVVDTIPTPAPGAGEALVKTLACGICGSDLHALKYADKMVEGARKAGSPSVMDLNRDIVMGHEFCAEVVGYSNDNPGGYGELMRLTEFLLLEVPNGLSTERAALTEPMAVGYHAVQKARLGKDDAPLVIGCGPVGLAVVAALKLGGVHPIVAADFSPRRRELALQMGADIVVDPKEKSPYQSWREMAVYSDPSKAPMLPPWMPGPAVRPAVIFECVGVTGVIDGIMSAAPGNARIVVVGVCMERDQIEPLMGISKELNIQFVLGYAPEEFAATLSHLAEGQVNADPLITGKVGVEGVAKAFEDLASPETHAKILVEPWRS